MGQGSSSDKKKENDVAESLRAAGIPDITIDRKYTHVQRGAKEHKISAEDFDVCKVLGRGSFGKVMLVRKKDTGTMYAMKSLRKDALLKRNQIAHTKTERFILQNINHPFHVSLCFAFQSDDKLFMVLEFMPGGELFFWLKKARKFSQPRAKLYCAEILLALDCLHKNDIIYRDLKPENILMDAEGHLRLADFGLSKEEVTGAGAEGGTKTFCGTPEYLAPEILRNRGHGKAVDWWSLGTLLFEMLNGLPPFYNKNMQKMYDNILHAQLVIPRFMGAQAADLITKLLKRKVEDRLGSGPEDGEEIKAHEFFTTLDGKPFTFEKCLKKEYTPEFKPPKKESATDVSNFDPEFTKEKARISVVAMSETQKEKSNFENFTFAGESALDAAAGAAATEEYDTINEDGEEVEES